MSFSPQDYQAVLAELARLADPAYKAFDEKLIPGTSMAYGVRLPALRSLAKQIVKNDPAGFLAHTRPGSYEEVQLRGMVLAGWKLPLAEKLPLVAEFLPLMDNWAVCDAFCSSFRLKEPELPVMWDFLLPLFADPREFYARFAAVMFLDHFVLPGYVERGLALLEAMEQPQYYVQMGVAWAVCECYVKFPALTLPLLQRRTLPRFTQNKALQKIRESYRVGKAEKDALLAYKK